MKELAALFLRFKFVLVFVPALLCSVFAGAQTDGGHKFLYIPTVSDGPDNSATEEVTETPPPPTTTKHTQKKKMYEYLFADFGTSTLNADVRGVSNVGNGMTLALCGQLATRLNSMDQDNQIFLSAGLELRNFNCKFGTTSTSVSTDNLHFWYAGIPVMFQLVNTKKHNPGYDNDINYYFQIGCTFGARISMSESRDVGDQTIIDQSQSYNSLLVQPFLSAGLSYTTQRKVCLIGPYVTYGINNISNQTGVTENIYSYGIRLTELLFR